MGDQFRHGSQKDSSLREKHRWYEAGSEQHNDESPEAQGMSQVIRKPHRAERNRRPAVRVPAAQIINTIGATRHPDSTVPNPINTPLK
jgi:hypothetical protein